MTDKEFIEELKQHLLNNSFEELDSCELRQRILSKINDFEKYGSKEKESVYFKLPISPPPKELKPEFKIKPTGKDYGLLFE